MTAASPDTDGAQSARPPTPGWAGSRPAAVILATSRRVASGYGEEQLLCLTEFEGRSVIEWWARYLDAWGITDRTIVAAQAHRSCFVPQPADHEAGVFEDQESEARFNAAVGRAVARRREVTDRLHVPASVAAACSGLGRYVFLGRDIPTDPLAQLLEVLPSIDNDLLLVIDGDSLPPPINPYHLLPAVEDAACLALGPVGPGWRYGYAIDWIPAAGQVPITNVIDDSTSAPPGDWFGESLGVLGVRRASILAVADDLNPIRGWAELLAAWTEAGELSARFSSVTSPRLTTTVELAAARAEFHAWWTTLALFLTLFPWRDHSRPQGSWPGPGRP